MASEDSKKIQEKLPDWKQKLEEFRKKLRKDTQDLEKAAQKIVNKNPDSNPR